MQNIIKKVYLSIMITILCMITLFTTTFAWIGFLDFSQFSSFDINIDGSQLEEYGIEISLTGAPDSFSSSVNKTQLKRVILTNMGYDLSQMDDSKVERYFKDIHMSQCSSTRKSQDKSDGTNNYYLFNEFYEISDTKTRMYYKFDLYLSPYHAFESTTSTNYSLDAFLEDGLFEGTLDKNKLINDIEYPLNPSYTFGGVAGNNNLISKTKISGDVRVNSASAVRLAIQKYSAVNKYDTTFQAESEITDLIIYQGGTQYPTYDENTDTYSFGGILEDNYNFALMDYNLKCEKSSEKKTLSGKENLLNRGDKEFRYDGLTNKIIDKSEGIGVDKMVKLTCYFWFEGWDADCFSIINLNPVNLNLRFSTVYRP